MLFKPRLPAERVALDVSYSLLASTICFTFLPLKLKASIEALKASIGEVSTPCAQCSTSAPHFSNCVIGQLVIEMKAATIRCSNDIRNSIIMTSIMIGQGIANHIPGLMKSLSLRRNSPEN